MCCPAFYVWKLNCKFVCLGYVKSFDKLNHYALFSKLMDRNVHASLVLLNVLVNWYSMCAVVVRWDNVFFRCTVTMWCQIGRSVVLYIVCVCVCVCEWTQC